MTVFKEDFQIERADRERAQAELLILREEGENLKQAINMLVSGSRDGGREVRGEEREGYERRGEKRLLGEGKGEESRGEGVKGGKGRRE